MRLPLRMQIKIRAVLAVAAVASFLAGGGYVILLALFALPAALFRLVGIPTPRYDRWLAHARGEDVLVRQDRDTKEATPTPIPANVVEFAGKPVALERVPIRAEHRDAQRAVIALAERRTGRRMTWGQARKWAKRQQQRGLDL